MSPPLASDVMQLILGYLTESQCYKLRSSGDRWMNKELGKRKSAVFATSTILPRCWPSCVNADTPLERLSITVVPAMTVPLSKKFLDLAQMPRTLRSLSLNLKNENVPFVVHHISFYDAYKLKLTEALPLLDTLRIQLDYVGGFWVIPDSVTDLELTGSTMVSAHLPPNIRRLVLPFGTEAGNLRASKSLEWFDGGDLDNLPPLPSLTRFSGRYAAFDVEDTLISRFPALTSLTLHISPDEPLPAWIHPTLTFLNIGYAINAEDYCHLPRSLTKWTEGPNNGKIPDLDVLQLAALPRSLRYVQLPANLAKKTLPSNIIETLPPKLVHFWAPHVAIDPSHFKNLPTTVTTLGIHNLKRRSISHLKSLMELTLFGGTLSVQVAKSLPRSLVSLTLEHVALRTKGHYKTSKGSDYTRFSMSNPQFSALSHLPPLLAKITISPHLDHRYYFQMPLQLLQHLPNALEEIGLLYHHEVISLSNATLNAPLEGFQRFHQLRHLFFNAKQETEQEAEELIVHLPTSLVALYVLSAVPSAARSLPPNAVYFGGQSYLFSDWIYSFKDYRRFERAYPPGTDAPPEREDYPTDDEYD